MELMVLHTAIRQHAGDPPFLQHLAHEVTQHSDNEFPVDAVEGDATVAAFQALLEAKVNMPAALQDVLCGFPPKPVQWPADRATALVSSLGIVAGDTLTVRRANGAETGAAMRSALSDSVDAPATHPATTSSAHNSVEGMVRSCTGTAFSDIAA